MREEIVRVLVPFRRAELQSLKVLDADAAERSNVIRRKLKLGAWKAQRGRPPKRAVGADALIDAVRGAK